ncbi:MAG: flagellar hook capping FlgD N-terminal domain-containing protein [Dermatophilus congolensis]|nr:flagellar hook capping FlgD N-terminal domain-containing protein [Dermatophilus congolensis]
MTDVSGVTSNTAPQTQTTANNTGSTSGSSGSGVQSASVQETKDAIVVKIKQPDGSSFDYVIPTTQGSTDSQGNATWSSTPAPGMTDFAKVQNRKYGMQLDADDFMNLLVAQLRYQDPSKPADTAAMMQQTASMAMVERVNELAGAAESMTKSSEALAASNQSMTQHLGALLAQQSLAASIGLIGQTVTYDEGAGDASVSKTGVVESVKLGDSGPILQVNGKDVSVDDVTGVSRTAAPTTEPAATEEPAPEAPAASGDGAEPTA